MVRSPSWPCAALLLAGALLLVLGGIGLYGRAAIVDQRAFATRASAAFAQDEVRDEVAERLTRRELQAEPALAPLRPTVEAGVDGMVQDWRFAASFQAGAVRMHDELFSGSDVTLAPPGTGRWLRSTLPEDSRARRLLPPGDPQ